MRWSPRTIFKIVVMNGNENLVFKKRINGHSAHRLHSLSHQKSIHIHTRVLNACIRIRSKQLYNFYWFGNKENEIMKKVERKKQKKTMTTTTTTMKRKKKYWFRIDGIVVCCCTYAIVNEFGSDLVSYDHAWNV